LNPGLWKRALAALLAAYLASYAFDSALGGYWPIPDDAKQSTGISDPEDILWQPRFGYWSARWSTILGSFYSPLIRLDRRWTHRSRRIFVDGFDEWFFETAPLGEFHPAARESVRLTRILKKRTEGQSPKERNESLKSDPDLAAAQKEGEALLRASGWR
jgi:hypothetical protein